MFYDSTLVLFGGDGSYVRRELVAGIYEAFGEDGSGETPSVIF